MNNIGSSFTFHLLEHKDFELENVSFSNSDFFTIDELEKRSRPSTSQETCDVGFAGHFNSPVSFGDE